MQKIYLHLLGRIEIFIKLTLFVFVMGLGENGQGQAIGDFQPKNATGNWSDFNSWTRYNGVSFVPAILGQIPASTSDIYFTGFRNIFVDITTAACNNIRLSLPGATEKISFSAGGILYIHGSLFQFQSNNTPFSSFGAGSKIIFTGSGNQTITNSGISTNLNNVEINKSGGVFTLPGVGTTYDVFTLTSGTLVASNGADLIGQSITSSVNVNGGTWTQMDGATRINGGANGADIALKINNATMSIATTSKGLGGFNLSSVTITNGGVLNIFNSTGNINITNSFSIDPTSTVNSSHATTPSAITNNFLGTFNYNAAGNQNIINSSYGNLGLLISGTKTPIATLNILNNLIIEGLSILPLSTSIGVNIGGDWTSYGTVGLTESNSIINFNGTGAQSINTNGGEDFFRVAKTGSGSLLQKSDVRLSGTASELSISAGTFDASTNTLSGTGSTALVMSGGTLKFAKLATTLPEFPNTSGYSLTGGTIEFNGSGAQILRGGQDFRNLTFSGSTSTTLSSTFTTGIVGTVFITGTALLDIGASNMFGGYATNLFMDGGRFKMSGSGDNKPDIDGNYNLTGGVIEFAGSWLGAQPIKGKTSSGATNIIYKNIEVTGTNVGTGIYNIFLNQTAGNFVVKGPDGVYAPNTKSIISENNVNTSSVTIEDGATFKIGNNQGFSGTTYTVPSNSAIDNNISGSRIFLNQGSTVDYAGASAQTISNKIPYQNFAISAITAVNKTAPGIAGGDLIILGNISKAIGSTFAANGGTVSLEGTSVQIYSGAGSMEFYTIVNKNTTGGFTVSNDFGVVNQLKLNPSSKLTFGSGNINLRSSATQTCNIPDLGTINMPIIDYTGTGRFQIERFLRARSSWRLLATPVEISSSASITNSWREGELIGTNSVSQYGTRITGPTGMDEFTQRYSMKSYNGNNNNYVEVNTPAKLAGPIANNEGYYIFVRGDRTVGVGGLGTTTLRMRGKIRTGDQTFAVPPNISPSTGFQSIGNPYPSAVDFRLIDKKNIAESFYIWNPDSSGNFGVGKFEQYSLQGIHYTKTPGGEIRDSIQSGEAFFVQSITGGAVIIKENYKVGGSKLVSRDEISARTGVTTATVEINLHTINTDQTFKLVDGVKINFDGNFSNGIDNKDVRKINNTVDNLSIRLDSKNLIVERRNILKSIDTIFLALTNTRIAQYRFEIDPSVLENLPLTAYLRDKFLQTETQVSLTDVTNINFNITTVAASRAADRFMIVFKTAIIPGQFTGNFIAIAADKNSDKTNTLKWSYSNESNVAHYSVERSKNGTVFTGIGNKNAGNLSNIGSYIFRDSLNVFGNNYYRIKATSTTGLVQYSTVVKVVENDLKPFFVVQPNPVENKTLQINFERLQGDYNLKLIAKQGAIIFSIQITVSSAKEMKNILLSDAVAAGVYELVLVDSNGKKFLQTVFIK